MAAEADSIIGKYLKDLDNPIKTVLSAHKGVPASTFFDVTKLYGQKERIADLLNISYKTIQRYRDRNQNFDASNSEMLLKLLAIYKKGEEVFGEKAAFLRWLDKPSFGLGENVPFDLMRTSDGIDLVMEELIRIEYGDLA